MNKHTRPDGYYKIVTYHGLEIGHWHSKHLFWTFCGDSDTYTDDDIKQIMEKVEL